MAGGGRVVQTRDIIRSESRPAASAASGSCGHFKSRRIKTPTLPGKQVASCLKANQSCLGKAMPEESGPNQLLLRCGTLKSNDGKLKKTGKSSIPFNFLVGKLETESPGVRIARAEW